MKAFNVRLLAIFMLACLVATFPISHVQALGTIIYVKRDATGFNNGTSWTDAYTDLQSALSAPAEETEVWVAAGTYTPTSNLDRHAFFPLRNSVKLYGGFAGTETSRDQRKPAMNITILSGDIGLPRSSADNSYHVVRVATGQTVLDGFTITGGNANAGEDVYSNRVGGGLDFNTSDPDVSLTLRNVIFSHNSAIDGAGIYNTSGTLTLERVTFVDNTSVNYGGGMLISVYAHPVLTDVTFENNTSARGGAIRVADPATVTISNSTFTGNVATSFGGAIHNGGTVIITNSTFYDNHADSRGGGIYNAGTAIVTNDTFSHNSAAQTGADIMNNADSLYLNNSILANDVSGKNCHNAASFSGEHNLIENNASGGYACGVPMLTSDPKLALLSNNGGFTRTMALRYGSPALDAGNDVDCPAEDQRRIDRPQGSHCDLGAYEALPPAGAGLYDDTYPVWAYSGPWTLIGHRDANRGTLHQIRGKGSYAEVTFQGVQAQLTYLKAAEHGSINVYLDGGHVDTIETGVFGKIEWLETWTSPMLSAGIHTVRFETYGLIDLDAIRVLAPVVGAGTYDDTDPVWDYTGNWMTYSGSGPYNNTTHYTATAGSSTEVSFSGTQFILTYTKANNYGLIEVYVDNTLVTTLNAYSSSILWQQTYTSPVYPAGVHTVRFVHAGGNTYVEVDAIAILP